MESSAGIGFAACVSAASGKHYFVIGTKAAFLAYPCLRAVGAPALNLPLNWMGCSAASVARVFGLNLNMQGIRVELTLVVVSGTSHPGQTRRPVSVTLAFGLSAK